MNRYQEVLCKHYAGGLYNGGLNFDVDDAMEGDGLFRFMFRELDDETGCTHLNVATLRLSMTIEDLTPVLEALLDLALHERT